MLSVVDRVAKNQTTHIVWINESVRIASFHAVDGYSIQTFSDREFFMKYIHSLQERNFRFQ